MFWHVVKNWGRDVLPASLVGTWPVVVSAFFLMAAFGCIAPAITLQGESLGWSASSVGLLFTGSVIGRILALLAGPYVIRAVGLKVFLPCAFALITIALSLPSLSPDTYGLWMGHEILRGLMLGPLYVIFDLWIYARARGGELGRMFTLYYLASIAGYALGPILIAQIGVGNLGFALCVAASLIGALPILLSATPSITITPPTFGNLHAVIKGHGFLWIVCFIAGYATEGVIDFLGVFGLGNGLSETKALLLITWFVAGGLAMQYPLAVLMDKTDKRLFSLAVMLAGIVVAGIMALAATTGWGVLPAVFVLGGLCAIMGVTGSALLGSSFRPMQLMVATTMLNLCYDAGSLTGPVINGLMVDTLGGLGLPAAVGCMFGIGGLIAGMAYLRQPHTAPDTPRLNDGSIKSTWRSASFMAQKEVHVLTLSIHRTLLWIQRIPCARLRWVVDD